MSNCSRNGRSSYSGISLPLRLILLLLLLLVWNEEQTVGLYTADALLRSEGGFIARFQSPNKLLLSNTRFLAPQSTPVVTIDAEARSINKAIISAFAPNITAANMEHLRLYLEANAGCMNQVNAVTLMHRCERYKQPLSTFLTRQQLLQLLASGPLSAQGIANILYSTHQIIAKRSLDQDCNEREKEKENARFVDEILTIVSKNLESSTEVFDSQAISNSLYGLRGISVDDDDDDDDDPVDKPLLITLSQLLTKIHQSVAVSGKYSMSAKGIGNAVLGFQSLSADDVPIIRQLVSRFAKYVRECYQPLDGQAIASIMIGLRSSSTECYEVNELIEAVVENVAYRRHSETRQRSGKRPTFKSKEISMILCGLQSTRKPSKSIEKLINTTLSTARRSRIWLSNGDEITAALTGLQRIGNNGQISKASIKYIIDSLQRLQQQRHHHFQSKRRNHNGEYSGTTYDERHQTRKNSSNSADCYMSQRQIATCIYAMQSMTTESAETRVLLQMLARTLTIELRGENMLDESNVARMIYGLQSMTCSPIGARDKAVRATLQIILSRLDRNTVSTFSGRHMAMITYGLKSMTSNTKEVRGLLSSLKTIATLPTSSMEAPDSRNQITNQNFAFILFGLQCMHSVEPSVRSYLREVLLRLTSVDDERQKHMKGQEIGMACFGLRLMSNYWPVVQSCILEIASRIDVARDRGEIVMNSGEMSMALNGLQSMKGRKSKNPANSDSEDGGKVAVHGDGFDVIEGLGIVSTQPKWVVLDEEEANWIPVSSAATESDSMNYDKLTRKDARTMQAEEHFGTLKGHERSIISLKTLLNSLYKVMRSRKSTLNFDQAASALYGFKGMSTDGMEGEEVALIIQELLEDIKMALTPSHKEKNVSISGRSVSAAFYGLQKMTCESGVVEELLIQLAYAIELVPVINGQLVGNVLLGMQNMDADSSVAVRMVLRALTAQVDKSKDHILMTGQNFGNALYGMKSMSSNSKEVRNLLSCIANLLKTSSTNMNGQNLGNALYGLQRMDESHDEVKLMLSALAHQLMTTTSKLSGLDIGMSLYGLRSMTGNRNSSLEVTILFGLLIQKIKMDPTLELKLGELSLAIIGVLRTSPWIRDDFLSTLASKTKDMSFITGTKGIVVNAK